MKPYPVPLASCSPTWLNDLRITRRPSNYWRIHTSTNMLSEPSCTGIFKLSPRLLTKTTCTLESVLRQLTALGDDINHPTIVAAIEAKLPFGTLQQVCRAKLQNPQWSISQLRQLIKETVADGFQARAISTSIATNKAFSATCNSLAVTAKPPQQKTTKSPLKPVPTTNCAFCDGRHYNDQCPVYKSTDERHTRATQKQLRLHCLRPGHSNKPCKSRLKPCFYRKGNHSAASCTKKSTATPATSVTTTSTQILPTNNDSTLEAKELANTTTACSSTTSPTTLKPQTIHMCRKTTICNPQNLHINRETLLFFDSGSQKSYMDQTLATAPDLPQAQERNLFISTFASPRPTIVSSRKTNILIKTTTDKLKSLRL